MFVYCLFSFVGKPYMFNNMYWAKMDNFDMKIHKKSLTVVRFL